MALISILAILILVKPTGVLISLAFKVIFKEEKCNNELKIGTYIGYLERIIFFLLCIFNFYFYHRFYYCCKNFS